MKYYLNKENPGMIYKISYKDLPPEFYELFVEIYLLNKSCLHPVGNVNSAPMNKGNLKT